MKEKDEILFNKLKNLIDKTIKNKIAKKKDKDLAEKKVREYRIIFENDKNKIYECLEDEIEAPTVILSKLGTSKKIQYTILTDGKQLDESGIISINESEEKEMPRKKEAIEEDDYLDQSMEELRGEMGDIKEVVKELSKTNSFIARMLVENQSRNQQQPEKKEDILDTLIKYQSFMNQTNNSNRPKDYNETFIEKIINENQRLTENNQKLINEIQKVNKNNNSGEDWDAKLKYDIAKTQLKIQESNQSVKDITALFENPVVSGLAAAAADKLFGAKDITPTLGTGKEPEDLGPTKNDEYLNKVEELRKKRNL